MIPILDGHNDTLLRLHRGGGDVDPFLRGREQGHLDLPRARRGGFAGGFFAVFVPAPGGPAFDPEALRSESFAMPLGEPVAAEHALFETVTMAALLWRLARASAGAVEVVLETAALRRCLEEGRLAAILHLEGAEAVATDLANLEGLHALGVRSIGPVWSRPNAFAEGVPIAYPSHPDRGEGLTAAGRELVRRCNRLGIVLDLAHLNLKGFHDVAELSTHPLVVTHACAHALCPTARNLTDDQLRILGQSGGVLGLNLHVGDLRPDGRWRRDTPIGSWLDHLDHVVERIGIEHVAIGSDFDGALVSQEIVDAAGLQRLLEGASARGYGDRELQLLAHGNWLRVLEATWGAGEIDAAPRRRGGEA